MDSLNEDLEKLEELVSKLNGWQLKFLIRYIEKTGKNDKNISDFLEVESNE